MGKRLTIVDELRGFTLISMILYHFMWDLKYIAGIRMDWYTGPFGEAWQQSICITFILISGFCFNLGKHHFRRYIEIFLAGAIITAVTIVVMPENRIIFGILTFIGSAGLIMIVIDKVHVGLENILDKMTLNLTMLIGSMMLFLAFYYINDRFINLGFMKINMPAYLYKGYIATFIGFIDPTFYSTDYFSLLPWLFLAMAGYYLYRVMALIKYEKMDTSSADNSAERMDPRNTSILSLLMGKRRIASIDFIGRNSLLIYMLHQPVLYGITLIVIEAID